jgi:hypothetical protein
MGITMQNNSTIPEQDTRTIEELRALEYDTFKDTNNVFKITDVYTKEEVSCAPTNYLNSSGSQTSKN